MKLSQIRYFIEVYRQANLTQAATILHVSQPTVTLSIKELETELGVSLFYRYKKRLYPTDAAHLFYSKAIGIIAGIDDLTEEMAGIGNDKIIRLGIPPMMGSIIFPQLFSEIIKKYPGLKIEVIEDGSPIIHKMLMDGIIDVGLIFNTPIYTNMKFIKLKQSEFVFCTYKNNKFACRQEISIKDIVDEKLAMFNGGFYVNNLMSACFHDIGHVPKIILQSNQIHTIKRIIESENASSIMLIDCISETDPIVTIPIKEFDPIDIGICYSMDVHLSSEVKYVIEAAKNAHF